MVAGDLVNTASRLQSAAAPPAPSSSARRPTARLARPSPSRRPASRRSRARPRRSPAWRALRVVAERGGRGRQRGARGAVRRARRRAAPAQGAVPRHRPRAAAAPGLGHRAGGHRQEPPRLGVPRSTSTAWPRTSAGTTGRSPGLRRGRSRFWALGEMVRGARGLAETDDEATTRARIAATVARARARTRPSGAGSSRRCWPCSASSRRRRRPEELFAAWRTFFERIAAPGTVVMVFEDLHWADAGLLDFIDHLLDWCRGPPDLVVTLARPELLDRRPDWGAGKRSFSVDLPRAAPEPADARAARGPGARAARRPPSRAIVDRAEGDPALRGRDRAHARSPTGELVRERRRRTGRPATSPRSRCRRRSRAHRRAAGRARPGRPVARPGRRRARAELHARRPWPRSAGMAEADARAAPARPGPARAARRSSVDPRSPERGQYAFVQALIREVAYDTLAKARPQARHLAAARYLEALGDDELAGALRQPLPRRAPDSRRDPRPTPSPPRRGSPCGRRPTRRALGSHDRRSPSSSRRWWSRPTQPSRPSCSSGPASPPRMPGTTTGPRRSSAGDGDVPRGRRPDVLAVAHHRGARGGADQNLPRRMPPWSFWRRRRTNTPTSRKNPAVISLAAQLARAVTLFFNGDHRRATPELADRVLEIAERQDLVPIVADTLVTKGTALCMGSGAPTRGDRGAPHGGPAARRVRRSPRDRLPGARQSRRGPVRLRPGRRACACPGRTSRASRRLGRLRCRRWPTTRPAQATWCGDWDWALGGGDRPPRRGARPRGSCA